MISQSTVFSSLKCVVHFFFSSFADVCDSAKFSFLTHANLFI